MGDALWIGLGMLWGSGIFLLVILAIVRRLCRRQHVLLPGPIRPGGGLGSREEHSVLVRMLDETQRADYALTGAFNVHTRSGRSYRLYPGTVGNVQEIAGPQGPSKGYWCLQTEDPVSITALQVTQLLLLSTNEAAFRRIARRRR